MRCLMKRLLVVTLVVVASACGSSYNPSPVTPTPLPTPTPTTPAPTSLSVTLGAPSPSTPRAGQVVTFPLTFSVPAGDLIQRVSIQTGNDSVASVRSEERR